MSGRVIPSCVPTWGSPSPWVVGGPGLRDGREARAYLLTECPFGFQSRLPWLWPEEVSFFRERTQVPVSPDSGTWERPALCVLRLGTPPWSCWLMRGPGCRADHPGHLPSQDRSWRPHPGLQRSNGDPETQGRGSPTGGPAADLSWAQPRPQRPHLLSPPVLWLLARPSLSQVQSSPLAHPLETPQACVCVCGGVHFPECGLDPAPLPGQL